MPAVAGSAQYLDAICLAEVHADIYEAGKAILFEEPGLSVYIIPLIVPGLLAAAVAACGKKSRYKAEFAPN